ncbi:MAG: ABC transporter permease subunit [bacterium]|nr:ABC transporter permease subunit [bacterium]
MHTILVIAKNTFREAIRDRVLYGMLGFAILFIALDLFMARLALGDLVMIRSFGLAGIYIFGLMITIFLGASIVHKEIERRTLYFVLSKPVARGHVIMGKFIGLFAAVALTTVLMALVYLCVIAYEGGGFDTLALLAIFFQMLEMGLFIALLVFFSSVVAPLTATICAIVILFVGHLLPTVIQNAEIIGGAVYAVMKVAYYILPNLEKFNLRNLVVHDLAPAFVSLLAAFGYAVLYGGILLFLAKGLLEKREL